MKAVLLSLIFMVSIFGQQFVELKLPNSNKIVVKFMFRNGSITDPVGKEGLTDATASVIAQGGGVNRQGSFDIYIRSAQGLAEGILSYNDRTNN